MKKLIRILTMTFCILLMGFTPIFAENFEGFNESQEVLAHREKLFLQKQDQKNHSILWHLQQHNPEISENDLNDSSRLIEKIINNNLHLQEYASLIREDFLEAHIKDEQFKIALQKDHENTIQMVNDYVASRLYKEVVLPAAKGDRMYSSNGIYAWVVADLVKQKNNYFCGPASALMAIDGMGRYVVGNTAAEKQETIARSFTNYPRSGVGSYVYDVRNCLNRYLNPSSAYYSYRYARGSSLSQSQFTNACYESLDAGMAPVLHARTQYLPYYNGHSTGHYITLTGIDKSTGLVRLHDPNRSSSYHGIHRVPISSAHNSVKPNERYLISGCL